MAANKKKNNSTRANEDDCTNDSSKFEYFLQLIQGALSRSSLQRLFSLFCLPWPGQVSWKFIKIIIGQHDQILFMVITNFECALQGKVLV